ncbi:MULTISPECIES: alpha/beta fold hydrolase [unclassified Variovorax]|uniref:PHA/PHB synthase family protein n=1 Tax=Variovorax sp. Sphag1AA TaxID=2587027 RepID=UPI00161903D0
MEHSYVCPAGHGPAAMDLPLKQWIARLANGISPASLAQAQSDWLAHLMVSPTKQTELSASALRRSLAWWLALVSSEKDAEADEAMAVQDKRFARPEWKQPPFDALARAFLSTQQWWEEACRGVRGVSKHHEDQVAFVARQWLDMVSPSNFVATNPEVLKQTLLTGGANLANGWINWVRDAAAVAGDAKPRGVEAFLPGKAVALTPGKVVMRNELAELIQYEPTTATVLREPVFIVPAWIMKFYILDLTPEDSLVKYLVDNGHTVFIVSWRNPRSGQAGLGMEDYVRHGVFESLDTIRSLYPESDVHAAGYCLGGTLLAISAALPECPHAIRTLTLFAAQTDFSEPGELGLFMDESQISFLEDLMTENGYLDGRRMAGAFQLINSKDLVWSKLVHEYLMGATTPMTALRAWNADATRMPARMHAEYLRHLYLRNDLAEGRYRCTSHEPVDLSRIGVPMFVVATENDHVSPWKSVYRIHRLVDSPIDFLLTSGGHNVGIVNPPAGPAAHTAASYRKAHHAARKAPAEPDEWFASAQYSHGSWWPAWTHWLRKHSSGEIATLPVQGVAVNGKEIPAPGSYVKES